MKPCLKLMTIALCAGLLIGSALGRFAPRWHSFRDHTPQQKQNRMLNRLSSRLKLTPDQRGKISAIIQHRRSQTESLLAETQPRFEAIRSSTTAEIRNLLTPEQQVKFDRIHQNREKFRNKHHPFRPAHDRHE